MYVYFVITSSSYRQIISIFINTYHSQKEQQQTKEKKKKSERERKEKEKKKKNSFLKPYTFKNSCYLLHNLS